MGSTPVVGIWCGIRWRGGHWGLWLGILVWDPLLVWDSGAGSLWHGGPRSTLAWRFFSQAVCPLTAPPESARQSLASHNSALHVFGVTVRRSMLLNLVPNLPRRCISGSEPNSAQKHKLGVACQIRRCASASHVSIRRRMFHFGVAELSMMPCAGKLHGACRRYLRPEKDTQ